MLVWAVLIFAMTSIGFTLWYVGLVLVVPWLGYATWHAYRDTLVPRQTAANANAEAADDTSST
jgi:uncharacterized membrane protein